MKFAIITDTHFGPSPKYKGEDRIMSDRAEAVTKKIIAAINAEQGVQFVAQLGDLIQDNLVSPSADEDRQNFLKARAILKQSRVPVYSCVGNHEPVNLPPAEIAELLGQRSLFYDFETEQIRGIVLFCPPSNHQDMVVPPEQMTFLKSKLESSKKPVLIFIHHSLADQDLTGNYWFEGAPERCLVQNRSDVRAVLEASGKVLAVFNGHLHWTNWTVHNDIPYVTVQSCVEDFRMDGNPSETYAIVTVDTAKLAVDIRGNNPFTFSHAFQRKAA